MIAQNINKKASKFRVLVAPLDWGLGHTTRCIPIIQELLDQDAEVLIAAEGAAATLIQNEFPSLHIFPLKGYKIRYSRQKKFLLFQLPRILLIIAYERRWLKRIVAEERIDAVISDNRFGMYNSGARCIYITHQLFIETGNALLNRLAQHIHYRYINHFDEIWVPDAKGELNLAGKLSHPKIFPLVPVKYLGILSRFAFEHHERNIDLLIILSGPEPQRTNFENILLKQIKDSRLSIVLLRGLPGSNEKLVPGKNSTIYNHLPATRLNSLIQQSHLVLARGGYSTIMDLAALHQKAILVPTPGQTEQEYLGKYLHEKKLFFVSSQQQFSLDKVLSDVQQFEFAGVNIDRFNDNILSELINDHFMALQ